MVLFQQLLSNSWVCHFSHTRDCIFRVLLWHILNSASEIQFWKSSYRLPRYIFMPITFPQYKVLSITACKFPFKSVINFMFLLLLSDGEISKTQNWNLQLQMQCFYQQYRILQANILILIFLYCYFLIIHFFLRFRCYRWSSCPYCINLYSNLIIILDCFITLDFRIFLLFRL